MRGWRGFGEAIALKEASSIEHITIMEIPLEALTWTILVSAPRPLSLSTTAFVRLALSGAAPDTILCKLLMS